MKRIEPATSPVATGSPLACLNNAEAWGPCVYYLDSSSHIWQLASDGNTWSPAWDLTQITEAEGAAITSPLTCCDCASGGGPCVFYLNESWNICELAWNSSSGFKQQEIATGALPNGPLTCMYYGYASGPRVYYLDQSGNVWELYWDGQWGSDPLTGNQGQVPPPAALTSPLTCCGFSGNNGDPRVYYFDGESNVWELAWSSTNTTWSYTNVTKQAGASPAAANSPLTCFDYASAGGPRLYYFDSAGNVWELWYNGTWNSHSNSLNSLADALPAAPTSPLTCCGAGASSDPRVYYLDSDWNVWELSYNIQPGTWLATDVTVNAGAIAAMANSPLTCCYFSGGPQGGGTCVYFLNSTRQDVQQLEWIPDTWCSTDVSVAAGA